MNKAPKNEPSVVVIGAGPAGCAAAIALHMAGIPCIVLEARPGTSAPVIDEPRESLHPGVAVLLRSLGAEHAWSEAARGVYAGIVRNGRFDRLAPHDQPDWYGVHIKRSVFDLCLRERARLTGAVFHYGCRVTDLVIEDGRVVGVRCGKSTEHRGAFVIDASGRQHLGARRMRFPMHYASGSLVVRTGRVDRADAGPNSAMFAREPHGWCWWAADNDGKATWTRVAKHAPDTAGKRNLNGFGGSRAAGTRWCLSKPVACEGMLMVGDAASVLDPASGHGVFKALQDGLLAAATIKDVLLYGAPENWRLAEYDLHIAEAFNVRAVRLADAYRKLRIPLFEPSGSRHRT